MVALPNILKNGTYQIEESVIIMDSRMTACIPTMKKPLLDKKPCYYQLSPGDPCMWTLNMLKGIVSNKDDCPFQNWCSAGTEYTQQMRG
jgi:hypothetical protein